VLLATDDLDDIEHCDRIVVLVRGRVAAEFHRDGPDGRPFDREALIAATEGLDTSQQAQTQTQHRYESDRKDGRA
jgi:ABC-type multidrug transport system ATPase subunit